MRLDNQLESRVTSLLRKIGEEADNLTISSEKGGGNNQSFKLKSNGKKYFLKKYFFDEADKRNRLQTEVAFLEYAKDVAHNFVPKVFGFDLEKKIGIYEYIDGQSILTNQVGECDINAPINFFAQLNRQRNFSGANASEACFSLSDHLNLIEARVHSLAVLSKTQFSNSRIDVFLQKLLCTWEEVRSNIFLRAEKNQVNLDKAIESNERCISPSDFGFHNAIRASGERIIFIDFEYAGWDDPAKMACDFFNQIAVPAPKEDFDFFLTESAKLFDGKEEIIWRAKLLFPAYQIKWCCIALNILLPVNLQRRIFANGKTNLEQLKFVQLEKAEKILINLRKF
jgi:thiamine kinase-like enzyme